MKRITLKSSQNDFSEWSEAQDISEDKNTQ